jgi:hypothetical protein
MTEQSENTAKTATKVRGVPFQKGKDPRRNLDGRPEGAKNFSTMFEEAIKIIVKEQRIPVKDPEVELVVKGVTQALRGNYSFWKDIMDRTYGSPNKSETNVNVGIVNYTPQDYEEGFVIHGENKYGESFKRWYEENKK